MHFYVLWVSFVWQYMPSKQIFLKNLIIQNQLFIEHSALHRKALGA